MLVQYCSESGLTFFEEICELISMFVYFLDPISPEMWTLWPKLVNAVMEWGIDFFQEVYEVLDHFITKGTQRFMEC